MTKNNSNLHNAKRAKNDEFYTQYSDIEKECVHYRQHFKDQWIYLPCDDEKSNFWKYFVDHFTEFKLRHLTGTHIDYNGSSYRLDYDGTETTKTPLNGNGDFRSEECSQIRDDADLICTNPPFSIWVQFMEWIQGMKKFIIIGNSNAITQKNTFPHIASGEWFVRTENNKAHLSMDFIDSDGNIKNIPSAWFTNIAIPSTNSLTLTKKYNPNDYPKYDNIDAINVNRIKDIPYDYDGCMGVPISIVLFTNQFEIVGAFPRGGSINGHFTYKRVLVKKRKVDYDKKENT